jgi:hypothetical protein
MKIPALAKKDRLQIRAVRVRRLFDEVWAALPSKARARIMRRLAVVSDRTRWVDPRQRSPHMGGCAIPAPAPGNPNRFIVYLASRRLDAYGDGFVKGVIAHELAHVYLSGIRFFEAEVEAVEMYTEMQVADWGFEDSAQGGYWRKKRLAEQARRGHKTQSGLRTRPNRRSRP